MKKPRRLTKMVVVLTALLAMSFQFNIEYRITENGGQIIRIGMEKMSTILPDIVYQLFG